MGVLVPGKIKNVAAVLMQAVPFCDGVGFHVQVLIADGGALAGEVGVPDKEK